MSPSIVSTGRLLSRLNGSYINVQNPKSKVMKDEVLVDFRDENYQIKLKVNYKIVKTLEIYTHLVCKNYSLTLFITQLKLAKE